MRVSRSGSYKFFVAGLHGGANERRLLNDLMGSYQKLERPVANESDPVVLKFGLTLQQIMDVVRNCVGQETYSVDYISAFRMRRIRF